DISPYDAAGSAQLGGVGWRRPHDGAIGLTPLPMSMSSTAARATPRRLRGVALPLWCGLVLIYEAHAVRQGCLTPCLPPSHAFGYMGPAQVGISRRSPLLCRFIASVVAFSVLPKHELTATALRRGRRGSVGCPTLDRGSPVIYRTPGNWGS